MFGSLALTKMDCNRIANYFLLPVLFGLGYLNLIHYKRETANTARSARINPRGELLVPRGNSLYEDGTVIDGDVDSGSLADAIELILCNRLAILSVVHLVTNMLSEQIAKIIS